jgi:hypothetical protein
LIEISERVDGNRLDEFENDQSDRHRYQAAPRPAKQLSQQDPHRYHRRAASRT